MKVALVGALIGALTLANVYEASACSVADSCGIRFLANGATVPANAPVLAFEPSPGTFVRAARVTVLDGAGAKLAEDVEVALPGHLKLEKVVAGSSYALQFRPVSTGTTCEPVATTFEVSAPAAAPTKVGTASTAYAMTKGGERTGGYFGGPIVHELADGARFVSTADITVTPDPSLVPYLSLVQFETFVDGKPWAVSPRGEGIKRAEGDTDVTTLHDYTRVYAWCPTNVDASTWGGGSCVVSPTAVGKHDVEIRANIAGVDAAIEPIRLTVDLSCPKPAASGAAPAPASAKSAGDCAIGASSSRAAFVAPLVAISWLAFRRRGRSRRH